MTGAAGGTGAGGRGRARAGGGRGRRRGGGLVSRHAYLLGAGAPPSLPRPAAPPGAGVHARTPLPCGESSFRGADSRAAAPVPARPAGTAGPAHGQELGADAGLPLQEAVDSRGRPVEAEPGAPVGQFGEGVNPRPEPPSPGAPSGAWRRRTAAATATAAAAFASGDCSAVNARPVVASAHADEGSPTLSAAGAR